MVGFAALLGVVRLLRLGPSGYRGWIFIHLFLLGLIGAGMLFFRDTAGYVALGAWILLALLPSIGSRTLQRWALRQQFARARRLSLVLGWLHPLDGWRKQPHIFHAL